jgi:hypothetical protein
MAKDWYERNRDKAKKNIRNGAQATEMPSKTTDQRTEGSITCKRSCASTALMLDGLKARWNSRAASALAARRYLLGATSTRRRMSITATRRWLFAGFSATGATAFLDFAKTMPRCCRGLRGI